MLILQFTGLSGAGKSTLAAAVVKSLSYKGISVEWLDGDVYRKTLCKDLGFSRTDRLENIRRIGELAAASHKEVVIISAINPYEEGRSMLNTLYNAKLIWLKCDLQTLMKRDTKGLYFRAQLPDEHPLKVFNLSGVNDPFELPISPDLILNTSNSDPGDCALELLSFIRRELDARSLE